ncbi:MAG: hypothetical protein IJW31_01680 [Lentisphaeria bacterium]|nr:hypothetical protein [Lentisphaeria bacterium]
MKTKILLFFSLAMAVVLCGCKFHTENGAKENYYFVNSFWGDDYFYFVPFFGYQDTQNSDFLNILLFFNYHQSQKNSQLFENNNFTSLYCLLYYQSSEEKFQFNNPYRLNPELIKKARFLFNILSEAIKKGDSVTIQRSAFELNLILKALGINDLSSPTNIMMLDNFKNQFEHKLGSKAVKRKNIFFPLYYYSDSDRENFFSILYPLSEFKNFRNPNLTIPDVPNKISPYGGKKAVIEYDSDQILIVYIQEKLVYRKWKSLQNKELISDLMKNLVIYQNMLYRQELTQNQLFNKNQGNGNFAMQKSLAERKLKEFDADAEFPLNSKDCTRLLEKIIAENSVDITEKSYHLFPLFSYSGSEEKFDLELLLFFRYREEANSEEWSFLKRIFNLKITPQGKSGYLFFIPFGEK